MLKLITISCVSIPLILLGAFFMFVLMLLIIDLFNLTHTWIAGWHRQILPILFYLIVILILVIGVFYCAKIIPQTCNWWQDLESFFKCHPVFSSIIGTLIGLPIIFILLRPRLAIKRLYLYRHTNSTDTPYDSLSVCIKNCGLFPIHNVQVSVFWLREPNKNSKWINDKEFQREWKTKRIEFFRPEINSIGGLFNLKNNTYSCHAKQSFQTDIDERDKMNQKVKELSANNYVPCLGQELFGDTLLCRVQATHGLSGLIRVFEWKFQKSEVEGLEDMPPKPSNDDILHYKIDVNPKTGNAEIEKYKLKSSIYNSKL